MKSWRNALKMCVKGLLLLTLALPFYACEDDEYAGLTEETKALRKKYNEQMVGDWTYEYETDRIKYYSQINLDKEGNYRETEKVARPHVVGSEGNETTIWEVEYNETSTGKWYLEYVESSKRNTFNVSKDGMTITRIFYGFRDGQLLMSTAFTAGQAAYEPGKREPSFSVE